MLKQDHPIYLETVTFASIAKFTALQLLLLGIVYGITWAGIVGVIFPIFIILLIPARQYLMPRLFDRWSLSQLDSAEYEEAPPAPQWVIDEARRREAPSDDAGVNACRRHLTNQFPVVHVALSECSCFVKTGRICVDVQRWRRT